MPGRLAKTRSLLKKASTPKRIKIAIYDALIRSKLVYGLESLFLTTAQEAKITSFQLKGLRQILKITTTFINRANTNKKVFEEATRHYNTNRKNQRRTPQPFTTYLHEKSQALLGHILRAPDTDPIRQITFRAGTAAPNHYQEKRVGRPRKCWIIEKSSIAYHHTCQKLDLPEDEIFDPEWPNHQDIILLGAISHLF